MTIVQCCVNRYTGSLSESGTAYLLVYYELLNSWSCKYLNSGGCGRGQQDFLSESVGVDACNLDDIALTHCVRMLVPNTNNSLRVYVCLSRESSIYQYHGPLQLS